MSTRIRFNAEKFVHDNYSPNSSPATKTLPSNCTALLIDNVGSNAVQVSFDGGSNYKTVNAGANLSLDVDGIKSYMVQSSSGSTVECLYGAEA